MWQKRLRLLSEKTIPRDPTFESTPPSVAIRRFASVWRKSKRLLALFWMLSWL